MADTFVKAFFRLYDRKIASGEITFRETGLSKEEFTNLCTMPDFVPGRARIEKLSRAMKLTAEETANLLSFAPEEEPEAGE